MRYSGYVDDYGRLFTEAAAAELRAERAVRRVTFGALMERTGLSKSALLHYFNGQRDIPLSALRSITQVLGVSPGVILDRALARYEREHG